MLVVVMEFLPPFAQAGTMTTPAAYRRGPDRRSCGSVTMQWRPGFRLPLWQCRPELEIVRYDCLQAPDGLGPGIPVDLMEVT
ncbi:hypothetical protein CKO24_14510 [Rhodothalassium salexigens DSM 2132]|nr:hypothetical protein [Rhodothalassium salexigens DSM 2132]